MKRKRHGKNISHVTEFHQSADAVEWWLVGARWSCPGTLGYVVRRCEVVYVCVKKINCLNWVDCCGCVDYSTVMCYNHPTGAGTDEGRTCDS
ncbi:hypothetical protein O3P69_006846 [Scylla paramamosain]|uniref:Uncharacterized protein n=1 Tax=Scylla paramamosain TaxID=85552 RepID=A0AAW0U191_SCYPA